MMISTSLLPALFITLTISLVFLLQKYTGVALADLEVALADLEVGGTILSLSGDATRLELSSMSLNDTTCSDTF